jgi:hypothetical protein
VIAVPQAKRARATCLPSPGPRIAIDVHQPYCTIAFFSLEDVRNRRRFAGDARRSNVSLLCHSLGIIVASKP